MKQTNEASGASANDGQSKDNTVRAVRAKKVSEVKRKMVGAEKRMKRLQSELKTYRARIRRKYDERLSDDGQTTERVPLSSAEIAALRLCRSEVEGELALAKREHLESRSEYLEAVKRNHQITKKRTTEEKKKVGIIRNRKALLKKTEDALEQLRKSGNSQEFDVLRALAVKNDVKVFRQEIDEKLKKIDPSLLTTISGISQVKTKIIHDIMDRLKKEEEELRKTLVGDPEKDKSTNDGKRS